MAVIEVKKPILLDSSLNDLAMLHPVKGSLTLNMNDVSEASLTLGEQDDPIPMHSWVKIYNQLGFVGIFRRTSQEKNITADRTYTLRHGIDILQDSVWAAETDFSGTMTQFLTQLLNQQTHLVNGIKPWVLGTCADSSTVTKKINYNSLLELLTGQVEDGSDYYYTYDQTVWPWRINLVAKPSSVASEFRLNRNIEKCKISENDSEFCTRLILSVNAMEADANIGGVDQNVTVIRTYNNTAAQAIYGVIVKVADIDVTDSLPNGPFPQADAWAADFLAKRAQPQVQIQIDGFVLTGITGDTWDESRIATICRVALPDYAEYISERVVTVYYPDIYGQPDRVSASLANALPRFTSSIKNIQRTVARTARGGRSTSRAVESFIQHFEYADSAGNILKQAGMQLDADGLLVYADDNVNMVGARFNVQADKIGMVVGTNSNGNYVKAGEIALAINATSGESIATIDAAHVNISATNTVYTLAGDLEHDADGKLIIKSAGGMYVQRTESGATAQFGVWDNGNLTSGIMINTINGEATLTINAARVNLGAYATVSQLEAVDAEIQNITGGTIVENYVGASLVTGTTVTAVNTFTHAGDTIYKRAMRWSSGGSVIATVHALGDTSSIVLNHSHAMTVSSSGVVTVGDAQESSGTFNIADTAFYQTQVASAWNSGGATAYADKSSQYAPYGGSVTINIKYTDHDGNAASTGRSVTIWNTSCSHTFGERSISSNGTFYASTYGYSGFSKVVVSGVRTVKHTDCADSLTKSGTHALMYVPDSSGITITTKVKNISNASRVWYYRGSDQSLFTAYTAS